MRSERWSSDYAGDYSGLEEPTFHLLRHLFFFWPSKSKSWTYHKAQISHHLGGVVQEDEIKVVKNSDTVTQSQLTMQSGERFNKFPSKTYQEKSSNFLYLKCLLSVSALKKEEKEKFSTSHENVSWYLNCFEWSKLYVHFWASLDPFTSLISIKQINQGKLTFTGN